MRIRKFKTFACDFETTVYKGQQHTEVWSSACVELNTEDVKHMRILYMDNTRQTIFSIFPQYNERLITSVLSGQNWGHLPIYHKKQKRWTYPEGWKENQIKEFQEEINNYRKEII